MDFDPSGIELNEGQRRAVNLILSGADVFLTGEGGTGKSLTLVAAVRQLRAHGREVVVCAPTGVAAQNIGGATIHRTLHLNFAPKVADQLLACQPTKVIHQADTLVVDEVGMVRRDLMDAIARIVRVENARRREADGEDAEPLQVVLAGDFSQIPPVVTLDDRKLLNEEYGIGKGARSGFYAFESDGWEALHLQTVTLTDPMRQSDPTFVSMLNRARVGDASCIPYFNHLCEWERGDAPVEAVRLVGTNKKADAVNKERMAELPGRAKRFVGTVEGDFKPSAMSTPKSLSLKVGARVMILANDSEGGYVNGSMGVVSRLAAHDGDRTGVGVTLDDDTETIVVPKRWENIEYELTKADDGSRKIGENVIGTYVQMPLKPCWAVTYHKAQGKSLDRVLVDPMNFDSGMLYVGLSRATTASGLWLTRRIRDSDLRANGSVVDFYVRCGWEAPGPADPLALPDLGDDGDGRRADHEGTHEAAGPEVEESGDGDGQDGTGGVVLPWDPPEEEGSPRLEATTDAEGYEEGAIGTDGSDGLVTRDARGLSLTFGTRAELRFAEDVLRSVGFRIS
jgi:ATP-dependent DNA helicase PIF1